MKTVQRIRILDLLRKQEWVCVEEMLALYIVDYRRRLVDIKRMGYELESRKCKRHVYHQGGSKEWRLKGSPMPLIAPVSPVSPELVIDGLWVEKSPWTGEPVDPPVYHEIYASS